ncbi:hypothetical protein PAMC26577_15025 [Caballeronia sordidicola]|uniref:Uncharacterized protein n=1 Tax=Caballeronia sordidicola TaxID=196367 RepID=A0A242MTL4_CABSO|nr:hypothetical protein PAMC26577_15025 [Caballeronia sordidicola]
MQQQIPIFPLRLGSYLKPLVSSLASNRSDALSLHTNAVYGVFDGACH